MKLILSKFTLYETLTSFFYVGSNHDETEFRLLKISKAAPTSVQLIDDNITYTKNEMSELLGRIGSGNGSTGGLNLVTRCHGIVGFVRFLKEYYMIVITKRSVVATLGGHFIYHIDDTLMVSLEPNKNNSIFSSSNFLRWFKRFEESNSTGTHAPSEFASDVDEQQYVNMFSLVQLSKNFYFSYTYNLTQTLQSNLSNVASLETKFVWNWFLMQPLLQEPFLWAVPLIYGVVDQSKISVLSGKATYYLTLIGRRSRFMAGTRFLKRGVDARGNVANEVETEQIVHDAMASSFYCYGKLGDALRPHYTSFVQHRGSIPLFWGQEPSGIKPAISIQIVEPFFTATKRHFDQLYRRYGSPLLVLDLVKQTEKVPRESILFAEYNQAIKFLNNIYQGNPQIEHWAWDMARASKSSNEDVLETLAAMAEQMVAKVGIFYSGDAANMRQHGVVRSNCIDCLDRTNAAQFMISKCALAKQLCVLGAIGEPKLPLSCDALSLCKSMFHDHGDTIALQYGGSNLVNTMETYAKNPHWTSHSRDMIESVRRYYNNSFTDADKQDSISLFLGHFVPYNNPHTKLWELPPAKRFSNVIEERLLPFSEEPIVSLSSVLKEPEANQLGYALPDIDYFRNIYRPNQFTSLSELFTWNILTNLNGSKASQSKKALAGPFGQDKLSKPTLLLNTAQVLNLDSRIADLKVDKTTSKMNNMLEKKFVLWKPYEQYANTIEALQAAPTFVKKRFEKPRKSYTDYAAFTRTHLNTSNFNSKTQSSLNLLIYETHASQNAPEFWYAPFNEFKKAHRPDYQSWLDTSTIC